MGTCCAKQTVELLTENVAADVFDELIAVVETGDPKIVVSQTREEPSLPEHQPRLLGNRPEAAKGVKMEEEGTQDMSKSLGAPADAMKENIIKQTQPIEEESKKEVTVEETRPNFTGYWVLERTEGDFDAFLADMGTGWVSRTAARGFRYGVGRVSLNIEQTGDAMKIKKVLADPRLGESIKQFRIGGDPARSRDDIGYVNSTCSWKDQAVHFEVTVEDSRKTMTLTLFFKDDGQIAEELTSGKGTTVYHHFKKQPKA